MSNPEIESASNFTDTPQGWQQRFSVEMEAADKETENWRKEANKILRYFACEREMGDTPKDGAERWNLFAANVLTVMAMLYGRVPEVGVGRRFADAQDDVGRVAGLILERMLNSDIQGDDDPYALALEQALFDRLVPGLAVARVRYEMEEEGEPHTEDEEVADERTGGSGGGFRDAPRPDVAGAGVGGEQEAEEAVEGVSAGDSTPLKAYECVKVEYVHWEDFRWFAGARTWHDVRGIAFKHRISKDTGEERFGKDVWATVPMTPRDKSKNSEDANQDPWARAEVWEIWDRATRKVYWWVAGAPAVLKIEEDPLGLKAFWPCPRPMFATTTTSTLVPIPDFRLAADQYYAIDAVVQRLALLTKALRVVGVYDAKQPAIKRVLTEATNNELIPVENWAMLGEAGGIKGVVDWFPLEQVANTIVALEERLDRMKAQLDEVTGMSDILRGQSAGQAVTATEQGIKAHFASARLQRLQDDFARFASECQQLKAEVIGNPAIFSPNTILQDSNILVTPDADKAPQAIALIQSKRKDYRVKVAPENLALADFAQLKADRMEVLSAIGAFLSAVMPLMQAVPQSAELVMGLLQWMIAGIKGGAEVEGMFDKALAMAKQAQGQPQQQQAPDPKLQAQMLKGQQESAKIDKELQADLIRTQAETQADLQREAAQAKYGIQEAQVRHVLQQQGKQMNPQRPRKP